MILNKVYNEVKSYAVTGLLKRSTAIYLNGFQKAENQLLRDKMIEEVEVNGEKFYKVN